MTAFNQSIAAEPPAVLSLVLFHQSTPQDTLKVVTISMKGIKLVIKNGHEFYLSIGLLEHVLSLFSLFSAFASFHHWIGLDLLAGIVSPRL